MRPIRLHRRGHAPFLIRRVYENEIGIVVSRYRSDL